MYDYDAIVIGAGLGGLSSAALLQNKGLRTLVCENTDQVGGCCSSVDIEGYRFDIGASIVELSFVIDELFKSMGKKTSDYIDFMPIDPIYGFVTEDGDKFTYPVDPDATRDVIAGFSPQDAANWDRFQKVGSEAINKAFGQVMTKPMYSFKDMLGVLKANPLMAKYLPYMIKNFEMVLTSFFDDEKVRSSMSLQSYFLGLPPALCPGYVTFLAYAEHEGIFYPRGGMIGIPRGIANAFEEMGGEIKLNTRVKRVLTEGKRVIGVELADGTRITAKIVVSDINAKTLYLDLIGRENLPGWASTAMRTFPVSIPAPMIMLGLDTTPDLPGHHTFCYTNLKEMNRIWFEDYVNGKIPSGGFMLISWPSHADPSMAPEGHHCLNMVTFAPYNLAEGNWDSIKEQYLEDTLDMMERLFHLDIRDNITVSKVITPFDLERQLLHPQGAVYGLQNDFFSTAMFRPRMRSRLFKGLYLAGASVHLGGGVPTTIGSGVAVGSLVEQDLS
jgi:phytoene desaturase